MLQSLAGVVAVGGTVGGAFAATNALSKKEEINNPDIYEKPKKAVIKELEKAVIREEENKIITQIIQEEQEIIEEVQETETIDLNSDSTTAIKDAFYLITFPAEINTSFKGKDLWTSATNNSSPKKEKNYECINQIKTVTQESSKRTTKTTTNKDNSCLLYSLNSTIGKSIKISEIQAFINNTTTTSSLITKAEEKAKIKKDKFFLLKINEKLNMDLPTFKKTPVKLVMKNETNWNNKTSVYSSITVHAKISTTSVEGAANLLIAKATSDKTTETLSASSSSNYECKFNGSQAQKNCRINKLNGYATGQELNLQALSLTAVATQTNIEPNSYYLIRSDNINKQEAETLKGKVAEYIETKSNETTKTTSKLTIETLFFAIFAPRTKILDPISLN